MGEAPLPAQGPSGRGGCGQDAARASPRLSSCTSPPSPPLSPSFKRLYRELSLSPGRPQLWWEGREQRAVGGGWRREEGQALCLGEVGRGAGPCGEGGSHGLHPQRPCDSDQRVLQPRQARTGLRPPPPHQQADDRIFQISPPFLHPDTLSVTEAAPDPENPAGRAGRHPRPKQPGFRDARDDAGLQLKEGRTLRITRWGLSLDRRNLQPPTPPRPTVGRMGPARAFVTPARSF